MDVLTLGMVAALLIAGLLVLDLLALRFGADSRAGIGDDHRRWSGPAGRARGTGIRG